MHLKVYECVQYFKIFPAQPHEVGGEDQDLDCFKQGVIVEEDHGGIGDRGARFERFAAWLEELEGLTAPSSGASERFWAHGHHRSRPTC